MTSANGTPVNELPVTDVMSRALLTVGPNETVLMAWELVNRAAFHHLPVVAPNGRCLGILGATELAVACASSALARRQVATLLRGRRARSVSVNDTAGDAAKVMTAERTDAIPVLDSDGVLVGLVTARDLVAAMAGRRTPDPRPANHGPMLFRLEPAIPPRRT